eukprot:CAMPEP_0201485700 /NCGR_PEP_ID=MMETSP0151_2-20130828/9799_1 /ASSEMBLY_ACC=CAM_ASM_000257 /TAXON_ID=200890 /ORGANISM="Paramoeba atlantica, Strain 621/1 / CCAP 1560/9" /LENGTH=439 /DNA_ID=CAMNT_0047869949 /DNA_START=61 /DNA_END=1377 /DNA_ORIENTATION=-
MEDDEDLSLEEGIALLEPGFALWGGEEMVQKRAERAEDTIANVLKFFSTRVQLEEKYAKSLGGITSKAKIEGGSIGSSWQCVRDQQHHQISVEYTESTSKMTNQIVTPLEAAKKKYSADKTRLNNEVASLKKEMQRRTSILNEKKQTYWKNCENHFKEKRRLEAASESNPSKFQKIQAVYQKVKADMDQAEREYREYIEDYNTFKEEKYEVSMKAFLNEYEERDLERLAFLHQCLRTYAELSEISGRELHEFSKAIHEQFATFSASKDIHDFLELAKETVPPNPDQYEEYETEAVRNAKEDGAPEEFIPIGSVTLPKFDLPDSCRLLTYAVALFDFNGSDPSELSFKRGDTLTIMQKDKSKWWIGSLYGKDGLFPADYVHVLPDRASLPKRWPPPGLRSCTTRCCFFPKDADLLSFDEGDILVITSEFKDWYIGENDIG